MIPFVGEVHGRPGWYTELGLKATATKGTDENRAVFDPVNQVNGTTQISYRIYTLMFRVVSYDKDVPAFDIMDQIRRGLRSLSAKEQYLEIGIAFVDWGATRDLPKDHDNRTASECVLEVRLAWQVSADPGDDGGGVIQGVGSVIAKTPSDLTGITGQLTP